MELQTTDTELQTIPGADLTPMAVLDRAIANGAGVETLEKLMSLQERFQANNARAAFSRAVAELRKDLPTIVKSREVDFTTTKGRTNYKFDDLASIIEALADPLSQHGLSFRWRTDSSQPGQVTVSCILEHADGHSEETTLSAPHDSSGNKNAIQAIGSTVAYLQRYTLKAAIGIAAAQDDDGRQGAPQGQPPNGSQQRQPQNDQTQDTDTLKPHQKARFVQAMTTLRESVPPDDFDALLAKHCELKWSDIEKITSATAATDIVEDMSQQVGKLIDEIGAAA